MNEHLLNEASHALKLLSHKRIQSVSFESDVDEVSGNRLTIEVYYDDNVEIIKTKDGNVEIPVD